MICKKSYKISKVKESTILYRKRKYYNTYVCVMEFECFDLKCTGNGLKFEAFSYIFKY